jgi:dienelactone hydrolase
MRLLPSIPLSACIVPVLLFFLTGSLCFAQMGQSPAPRTNKELAEKVELNIDPVYSWRYAQGTGPYPAPTQTLTGRRRAFYPGEELNLRFQLANGKSIPSALAASVSLELDDINGKKVQEIGNFKVGNEIPSSAISWKVPTAEEGEYFLTARFSDDTGKSLTTRSEVVFLNPAFPQLRSQAEKALKNALLKTPKSNSLLHEISLPSVEMLLEDGLMRWDDFGDAKRDWAFVKKSLEQVRGYAALLATGKDPYINKTGVLVKAYRSELDNTLQPYSLYLPREYDSKRAYPLLVSLHGAVSSHRLNIRRVFGLGNRPGESDYEAVRNEVKFPEVDFIVVSPYGRGEFAGYNGIGEQDVLQVMKDVQKAYHVDPDQVYLTGLSMGGGGTWHLGLRYPDRWAAIVPVCAVADMSRGSHGSNAEDADRTLFDLTSVGSIAENAGNMSVIMYHGDMDNAVPVEQSRAMAATFEKLGWLGKNVRYYELPGVTHFAWDFSYRHGELFKLLAPIRRNPNPHHVVFSTFSPRYNKSYWLQIDRIEEGLELARIEGDLEGKIFKVKLKNVSAFSLLLSPGLIPPSSQIEILIDGHNVYKGIPSEKILSFNKKEDGTFRLGKKDATHPTPPDHMEASFRGRTLAQTSRHLYVYGTGGDAETTAANRDLAEKLADWGPGVKARWRVLSDREVTELEMKQCSLILIGGASNHLQIAELQSRLPVRQTAGGLQVNQQHYEGGNAAYRLVFPSPYAEGKYPLIYGASTTQGIKRLKQFIDVPRSPNQTADYLIFDDSGMLKRAGLFKDSWQIPEQ